MLTEHPILVVSGSVVAVIILSIFARFLAVLRHVPWFLKPEAGSAHEELLTVIIPARNEALGLKAALTSVLHQRGVRLEVLLVNDHSTDDTGQLADAAAASDSRLRVIHNPALKPGWLGKQNAMQVAADQARGDYVIFTDADIDHHPDCFASALTELKRKGGDFLSLLPKMRFESVFENAHLPNVIGFFAFFMSAQDPQAETHTPVAAGAFMLLRRELFESLGGFGPIRNEILDDVELARLVKKRGGAVHYYFAPDLLRVRMFRGNREAFWGATKNILACVGGFRQPWLALPIMVFPWLVYGMPWICLGLGLWESNMPLAGFGLALYLLQYLMLLPCARFIEYDRWRMLGFPLVAIMDSCCILRALYFHYIKGAVLWRDRVIKLRES